MTSGSRLLRGKAYRFSYWITFVFLGCVMMVDLVRRDLGLYTVPGHLLLWCAGAVLGLSFNFYCLLADVCTPPADDPWGKVVGPLFGAGLWLFSFFGNLKGSALALAEEDSSHWLRLVLGISLLVQGIIAWIQIFRSRKEKG